jgi:glycosyl transferase, family 25
MFRHWTCLVINLERSPDRLARISGELDRLHIPFERFAAVEGRDIDPDATPHFSRANYERRHGKHPTPCEIGCYMSHMGAMQRFLDGDAEFALILEDDAILGDALPGVLMGLEQHVGEWNISLLYGNYPGLPQKLERIGRHHELVGFLARETGAVAYAVDRKAATAYLDMLVPMSLPFDVDFDRAWDFGIKFRGVMPFPVTTGAFPSDIGQIGRKFSWYRRLPTYLARGINELRRYKHYAFDDPIWLEALRYRLSSQPEILAAARAKPFAPGPAET